MTISDLSPIPVNFAVKSYLTCRYNQTWSSLCLNKSTDYAATTRLGKLVQILTALGETGYFLKSCCITFVIPGCGWDQWVPRPAGRETSCWWVCEVHCGTGPRDVSWYWKTRRRQARRSRCRRGWWVPAASDSRWRYAADETGDCAAAATSCKFPT